jgi:hypothetical protein
MLFGERYVPEGLVRWINRSESDGAFPPVLEGKVWQAKIELNEVYHYGNGSYRVDRLILSDKVAIQDPPKTRHGLQVRKRPIIDIRCRGICRCSVNNDT